MEKRAVVDSQAVRNNVTLCILDCLDILCYYNIPAHPVASCFPLYIYKRIAFGTFYSFLAIVLLHKNEFKHVQVQLFPKWVLQLCFKQCAR